MLPKALTDIGKIVSLHKAARLKEICVNRCQDTYFCVNQFWERFEASSSNILQNFCIVPSDCQIALSHPFTHAE
jgi:hypothetical protein